MASWRRSKINPKNGAGPVHPENWQGRGEKKKTYRQGEPGHAGEAGPVPDSKPIEPEGRARWRASILKWAVFILVIAYSLLSYYHTPILISIGEYLVVEHPLKKADLIVCLSGASVERGLQSADLYAEGWAPGIFVGREVSPDGVNALRDRGVAYPDSRDLLMIILKGLGVPEGAILTDERLMESTLAEAEVIRDVAAEKGYRSIILVTSPMHTRRSWLTFRKVFGNDKVDFIMAPSRYTEFRPEDWWKTRKYVKEVIIEYQKLIYYTIKYL